MLATIDETISVDNRVQADAHDDINWTAIEDGLPGLNWPCMCKLFYGDRQIPGRLIQRTSTDLCWLGDKDIVICGVSHWKSQNADHPVAPLFNWAELLASDQLRYQNALGSSEVNVISGNSAIV